MDMMDSGFDFISIIWSILSVLVSLAVLGICVYYLIVKSGAASILLTAGSFIQLLVTLFYSVGIRIFHNLIDGGTHSMVSVYTVVGAIGFIGSLCHASGLIVLIINHVNMSKKMKAYE